MRNPRLRVHANDDTKEASKLWQDFTSWERLVTLYADSWAAFYVVAFVKFLGVGAKAGPTLAGRFFLTL